MNIDRANDGSVKKENICKEEGLQGQTALKTLAAEGNFLVTEVGKKIISYGCFSCAERERFSCCFLVLISTCYNSFCF